MKFITKIKETLYFQEGATEIAVNRIKEDRTRILLYIINEGEDDL